MRARSRRWLAERAPEHVTYSGWEAIDRVEQERGEPLGRPRVKFVRTEEMLEAARSGVPVPRLIAMADLTEIKRMIATALPGAEVEVVDETGCGDHLRATVRAPQFAGERRIDQHRLVRAAVQPRMDDGSIHALSVKTESLERDG